MPADTVRIDQGTFPSGLIQVPFQFDVHKLQLVSGHIGSKVRESDGAIIPIISYVVMNEGDGASP